MSRQRGDGPDWLRIGSYAAAPGEHVLRVAMVSSLFPQLPHRSRAPFRVGMLILVLALVAFALLRWQAALIAVSALGLPLLFGIYLKEVDAQHDLPRRSLPVSAALGVGLGIGWAALTGAVVARSYDVAFATEIASERILRDGLAIPLGGAIVMLAPALLVRALRGEDRESMDGFLVGAVGAITFTAAAALTRMAPQVAAGVVARDRPAAGLIAQAGIYGLAMPLTAAAAGGMVGAALWFTRPGRRWLAAPLPAVVAVLVVYAALGVVDVAQFPQSLQLGLHLAIAAVALLVLRIMVQTALLRETHDPITREPFLCLNCSHVVPDMAFCPACGIATRASSRASRNARRQARPILRDSADDA